MDERSESADSTTVTRNDLHEAKDDAGDALDEAKDDAGRAADSARDKAKEMGHKASDAIEAMIPGDSDGDGR